MFEYLAVYGQRHDEQCDHDVRRCQGDDEVVGNSAQCFLVNDADDDQRVAEHRQHRDKHQDGGAILDTRHVVVGVCSDVCTCRVP